MVRAKRLYVITKSGARDAFATAEVVAICGVKLPTLHYWVRSGLIRASVYDPPDRHQGVGRIWSFRDLIAVRTVARLREAGVSLQGIRRAVEALREDGGAPDALARSRLVTDGNDVYLVADERRLISLLKQPGQQVWRVLAMADVVRDVEKAVTSQSAKPRQAKPTKKVA